jgi:hypothetical protein
MSVLSKGLQEIIFNTNEISLACMIINELILFYDLGYLYNFYLHQYLTVV